MSLEEQIGRAVLAILEQAKGWRHTMKPEPPDTLTTHLDADAGRLTIGRPDSYVVTFQIKGVTAAHVGQLASLVMEALKRTPPDTLAPSLPPKGDELP